MMEISCTLEVPASAARAWRALLDFGSYPQWHPFVRITGEGRSGAEIRYTLRKHERARGWTVDAKVVQADPCADLRIDFGVRGFMRIEEYYRIEPLTSGVTITHVFRCDGLLSMIVGESGIRRRLTPLVEIPLRRLARFLTPAAAPQPARQRTKGFRQPPRRR